MRLRWQSLLATRLTHAPRGSFDEFSAWLPTALVEHVEAGHAVLSIYANDPDQLKAFPPDVVSALQQATADVVGGKTTDAAGTAYQKAVETAAGSKDKVTSN